MGKEDLLAQVRDHTLLWGEIKTKKENTFVRKFDARVTVFENMAIEISVLLREIIYIQMTEVKWNRQYQMEALLACIYIYILVYMYIYDMASRVTYVLKLTDFDLKIKISTRP